MIRAKFLTPMLAVCGLLGATGAQGQFSCTTFSPLDDQQFALNAPVEIRFNKPTDTSSYYVYAFPDGGVDMQHSPVIKEFRNADVEEFSTVFQINHARGFRVRAQIGSLFVCTAPPGHNNQFTVLPDPSVTPTPTPTPVADPKATPAIKLDAYTVFGTASVADQAIVIQPVTIRNEGTVPLEIYDIKPYGFAPELIVLPNGFVPCTVIEPGGSLTLQLLAKADYAELAKLYHMSVTLLIICNDPDPPQFGGAMPDEMECYATRLRAQIGVSLESQGLTPQPTPAPYAPPAPCAAPTPTPTPASTIGNNWNLLGSTQQYDQGKLRANATKLTR